jgi:hypothetical protein
MILIYLTEAYIPCIKQNAEGSVISKDNGPEVNAAKTKYMVMFLDQNAGRSHDIKADNSSFEKVVEFKHLVTTLMNESSVEEEIKNRLKSNACCHLVQNLLSPTLLSKNTEI